MPPGYMDRDGCMKAKSLFSRTCGARNINPQVLFFYGHNSHFDDRATYFLRSHHIYPFILKDGELTNNQPNNSGHNLKLKRYYSIAKLK